MRQLSSHMIWSFTESKCSVDELRAPPRAKLLFPCQTPRQHTSPPPLPSLLLTYQTAASVLTLNFRRDGGVLAITLQINLFFHSFYLTWVLIHCSPVTAPFVPSSIHFPGSSSKRLRLISIQDGVDTR